VRALVVVALVAAPSLARAGAWTEEQGHFYLSAAWLGISTDRYFGPDFKPVAINRYTQNLVGVFGEVGILTRWLTATVEGTAYRRNLIADQGYTEGLGDWRLGLWSGLVVKPVRLSLGITLGIPTGDALPSAGPNADPEAQLIARSLPTGDGEWDVDGRLALGYSWGHVRRWPVEQYLIVEAGYWKRTAGFADAFVYRVELGTRFPWPVIERFNFAVRLAGVESFASNADAARTATGLGNGVTFVAPGVEISARVWRGLGIAFGVDSALRARSVADGEQLKIAIFYKR
jgi:hypothetical protein